MPAFKAFSSSPKQQHQPTTAAATMPEGGGPSSSSPGRQAPEQQQQQAASASPPTSSSSFQPKSRPDPSAASAHMRQPRTHAKVRTEAAQAAQVRTSPLPADGSQPHHADGQSQPRRSAGAAGAGAAGGAGADPAGEAGGPPVLDDFQLIKVIGKGSYGKVMLVRGSKDGRVYAMKMLRKDNVIKRNQVEHTKTERSVLEAVSHPFIVQLQYAFQTPKKLYMVLEFCPGGELFFHLSKKGRFSEPATIFFTAETTSAIAYLHSLRIIYRELKPENLLLDGQGHVKITDFGLSKEGIEDNISAKTMCGTPEYLAPEIVEKKGHGRAVDWYSIGALTFEMLTGLPPFYTRDREKLFQRIRNGVLNYPSFVTERSRSFIQGLLIRDPEKRLGSQRDGEEVKEHVFFKDIDWPTLNSRGYKPPLEINLRSLDDVTYFDKEFLGQPVVNSEVGERPTDGNHFDGFTYAGDRKK